MNFAELARSRVRLPDELAAVDLGSNSFHVIVARVSAGQLRIIDRLRNTLALARGLDPNTKMLSEQAMAPALAFLERIGQRLRGFPPHAVRAVGTNTLRSARNGDAFRRRAEAALGHRIEVIAGREEARLIYLGVAHGLAGSPDRRLVVDIGGGSTELIVGEGFEPVHRESLFMGCINMSMQHFSNAKLSASAMARAELAARHELEPVQGVFRAVGRETVIGCSGTIKAVAAVCRGEGWCEDGISASALATLKRAIIDAGRIEKLSLKNLRDDRRPVLAGGVAVLSAVFEALEIERMDVSQMALREGLLYDLLGRIRHDDVRGSTVSALASLYRVDAEQAERVARTARDFFDQVAEDWQLNAHMHADMLVWAARLHEVGLSVSHSQYHKHGSYLIGHSDLAGFSRQEQAMLASLVRGHRRKFPLTVFESLPERDVVVAERLCTLLRLAVSVNRARASTPLPPIELKANGLEVRLRFPPGWLQAHPLTTEDLSEEAGYLREVGFSFDFD